MLNPIQLHVSRLIRHRTIDELVRQNKRIKCYAGKREKINEPEIIATTNLTFILLINFREKYKKLMQ